MAQDTHAFSTIGSVLEYTLPLIDSFRKFPSKKADVLEELKIVFSTDSPSFGVVVKDGQFAETFHRKMGKGRMRALKKLLYILDKNYYQQIDFRCD